MSLDLDVHAVVWLKTVCGWWSREKSLSETVKETVEPCHLREVADERL